MMKMNLRGIFVIAFMSGLFACHPNSTTSMAFKEIQLTNGAAGHCLNSTQCFSSDDQWIVFDGRNHDTMIGQTSNIAMVNTKTGVICTLYQTNAQTAFGPGVGAATFSPAKNRILFIHGIRNASENNPYSISRRTGVAVDIENPGAPIFLDARDVKPPFTQGALRGGTHAHTWSGDGQWISFTYNDHILERAHRIDSSVIDLRTVGIMVPDKKVLVPENGPENNNGEMFSVLLADVTPHPKPGSDEIEKAFDEAWIGDRGYRKADGTWQQYAVAYQGNTRTINGELKTEIFVVDIPDNILALAEEADLRGTDKCRPALPPGLVRRRITLPGKGVSATPRHWLRTAPDGSAIAFLSADKNGHVQVCTVSPNGGEVQWLTDFNFSVQGPLNFSPDGKYISFVADNSVFITDRIKRESTRITEKDSNEDRPVGAVIWSYSGDMLCFNRYVSNGNGRFLQVFVLKKIS